MLVVNLYGGPGTGKSTNAAFVFAKLKSLGYNAEIVTEYAKDLTWEERKFALQVQPYVLGKQLMRLERLRDKVEVVVTDSPILLAAIYGEGYGPTWMQFIKEVHESFKTLDVFLRRNPEAHPYNPKGRWQTENEAMDLDFRIQMMLDNWVDQYYEVKVDDDDKTATTITKLAIDELDLT